MDSKSFVGRNNEIKIIEQLQIKNEFILVLLKDDYAKD